MTTGNQDMAVGILPFAAVLVLLGIAVYSTVRVVEGMLARRCSRREKASGFPVVTPVIPLPNDGPGCYKIVGVVAKTGTDTKMYIEAETLANAKVKAELRGVIVTDIAKA